MPAFCYSFAMPVESVTPAAESEQMTFDAQCLGWIREMSGGNEQALASFYDATLGRVYGVALRIVGDESLAEEVVTTVYHEAWTSATRYDAMRGRPITWLLTICRSRALDEYRRRSSAERKVEAVAALDIVDPVIEPDELLHAVEEGHIVHTLLAELSPDDRQLIALAFFKGLSHQQISSYTNMPLGTVKSRIRRALTALSEALPDAARGEDN